MKLPTPTYILSFSRILPHFPRFPVSQFSTATKKKPSPEVMLFWLSGNRVNNHWSKDRQYNHLYLKGGCNLNSNPLNVNMLFDINFIRRERVYTKLKYSRSPAYDIVSGGAAALLSGFIGFLISEKFGIELVDSGDFYTGFMYIVFLSLSCRPLLRSVSTSSNVGPFHDGWTFLSMSYLLSYVRVLFSWVLQELKLSWNRFQSYYFFFLTFEAINWGLFNLLLISLDW